MIRNVDLTKSFIAVQFAEELELLMKTSDTTQLEGF